MADRKWTKDYGTDLRYGMELMLEAVREYADSRAGLEAML